MNFDLSISVKVRFISNDHHLFLKNQGNYSFFSKSFALHFLKGTHQIEMKSLAHEL